ncbi:MAG: GNAT family N-acetyltransferase [Myxococcales bacterium]|nr:GNAT family N-acetyltransferase [Myxococcales bacterium]
MVSARAAWQRNVLEGLGFEQQAKRVEYRLPLVDAIARLEAFHSAARLRWIPIETKPGKELERAAGVLSAVHAGSPGSSEDDDPLEHLLSRQIDAERSLPPQSLQIGVLDEREVALVAPSVAPATGWSSLYTVGVLPAYRRQRLGAEAVLHGLRAMLSMGGITYHDGTDANNHAMLTLFDKMDAPRYRKMEQWVLSR